MDRHALIRVQRIGYLIATIVLASCGGGETESDSFSAERWVVEGPALRIGSVDDPAYAFQSVQALSMSPTGVLHSLHRGEAMIRRWNAEGEPAGTVGREGQGPGEFDTPSGLGFFGDTLWVMDRRAYRVSYFDTGGEFMGSISPEVDMSQDPDNPVASAPRPSLPLRDGSIYGRAPAFSDPIARGQLTESKHVLMDKEGENLGIVWLQPHRPTDVLALLRENGGTYSQQPFADDPISLVNPEGSLLVLDRRVYEGVGRATVTLSRIGMDGDTLLSRALEYTPEALPRELADSVLDPRVEGMLSFMQRSDPSLTSAKLKADMMEVLFVPDFKPAVRGMMEATDGSVWLQLFDQVEGGSLWWVLSEDFEPQATAVIPTGVRPLLIEEDAIWGVEMDEFDVNYIVKFGLVR